MLINKWLLVDAAEKFMEGQQGICLNLDKEPGDIEGIIQVLQQLPATRPFAIMISELNSTDELIRDSYFEKIITLFFQPNYYRVNYQPLVFVSNKNGSTGNVIKTLVKKVMLQGFENISIRKTTTDVVNKNVEEFAFLLPAGRSNLGEAVSKWLDATLSGVDPAEIDFLVSIGNKDHVSILSQLSEEENELKSTQKYRLATILYEQKKVIDEYRHTLSLKTSREKDSEYFLSVQKEERAKGIRWYYNEYEILPLWYKRFGHIIKVLMGKRTFRSLFKDNVKKYKD